MKIKCKAHPTDVKIVDLDPSWRDDLVFGGNPRVACPAQRGPWARGVAYNGLLVVAEHRLRREPLQRLERGDRVTTQTNEMLQ